MGKKVNRLIASILLIVMLFSNVFEISYAIGNTLNEEPIKQEVAEKASLQRAVNIREVSTWEEFKQAYNNSSVERIELKADIITSDIKGLNSRTAPLVIYGGKGDKATKEVPYYLLSIGSNELPLGKPETLLQEFRLENLRFIVKCWGIDFKRSISYFFLYFYKQKLS